MQQNLHTFYTLLVTQTISMLGSAMSAFVIGVWVYQETGDTTPLALAATFTILPKIFLSGYAGVLVDRFRRKHILLITDFGQAFATLLLLLSIGSDSFQLWHLYVVSAISGIFNVTQFLTLQPTITMLVPDEQRERANALNQITGPLSGIIAPVLAGTLLAFTSVPGVLAIDLFTFGIATAVLLTLTIPDPEKHIEPTAQSEQKGLKQLVAGFYVLSAMPPLLLLGLMAMQANFLLSAFSVLNTPYILERTGSEVMLGIVLAVTSAGMVAGALTVGMIGGFKQRMHTVVVALSATGLLMACYGIAQHEVLLVLFGFAGTFAIGFINPPVIAIFQDKVPPEQQGRAFAALLQMSILLTPISSVMAGVLADNVFEPAVQTDAWSIFAPVFGDSAGAGIGLMLTISSLLLTVVTLLMWMLTSVRTIEELPGHSGQPEATTEEPTPEHTGTVPPAPAPAAS